MMEYSKKGKKLFVKTGEDGELGYVGQKDIFSQFYYYIVGYREAANTIIETILKNQNNKDGKNSYMAQEDLNGAVPPVCFLYRQYLELALKGIYLEYTFDTEEVKIDFIKITSHNLCKIWQFAKPVLNDAIEGKEEENAMEGLDAYIKEFNEKDPTSFLFRYPIDKDLNPMHPIETTINLKNIMECMNEIEEFLSGVLSILDLKKADTQSTNYRQEARQQRDNENYGKALELFEKAITVRSILKGTNHPDIAILHIEIAHTYLLQNDLKNALIHYNMAIKLSEEGTYKNYPSLYIPYGKIGLIYHIQEDYPRALEYYEIAVIDCEKVLGEDHPRTIEFRDDIYKIKKIIEEHL